MTNKYTEENRISVADGLRGFAIIAITLLHSINHYNLYLFPEKSINVFLLTDQIIKSVVTNLSTGKAYGIFAMLFGFTFYLQLSNQAKLGNDFNYRFIWRMFILFIIGTLNSAFFAGEILVLYSMVGLILVPLRHTNTKKLMILSALFMLQPIILAKIMYILFDQNYIQHFDRYLPDRLFSQLEQNSFLEMIVTNLTIGKQLYWISIISNGERIFQAGALFIIGMLIGRKQLFFNTPDSNKFWKKYLIISLISYLILKTLRIEINTILPSGALRNMVENVLGLWSDFSVIIVVSAIFMKLYSSSFRTKMKWMEPFGKMSLTNYVMQSVIGSFLFYGYGLSLSNYCGVTLSFIIGIFILILQYYFCFWWLKHHNKGPLEQLWHRLTWIRVK